MSAYLNKHNVKDDLKDAVTQLIAQQPTDPKKFLAEHFARQSAETGVDYDALRADLVTLMHQPTWDDSSLAPVLIRLAWHSSGTYDKDTGKGGSCGATMRFAPESTDPENNGLALAREFLTPLKYQYPLLSHSDLWVLASYVAIEVTGGPVISFKGGRKDDDGSNVPANGNLPAAEKKPNRCPHTALTELKEAELDTALASQEQATTDAIRKTFARMGFDDREIVALLSGGHVYGRCHTERSGYAGPWVEEMTKFSNEYAADLLEDEWAEVSHDSQDCPPEMRPAVGNRQYVNEGGKGNQMMLISDMVLKWDPAFRAVVEEYAHEDTGEALLSKEFGAAFKKLTELGCGFD